MASGTGFRIVCARFGELAFPRQSPRSEYVYVSSIPTRDRAQSRIEVDESIPASDLQQSKPPIAGMMWGTDGQML